MSTIVKSAAVQISPVLYNRPELLSLLIDRTPTAHVHDRSAHPKPSAEQGLEELCAAVACE
jgi:aliphatic nitrilase